MIRRYFLNEEQQAPLVCTPLREGIDLVSWTKEHGDRVLADLHKYGALLFRGFDVRDIGVFEHFIEATSSGWAPYREPSTPRMSIGRNLVTSTEYPRSQRIFLHNENSHCTSWPLKIYFHCVESAERGGQTPIADCRRVLAAIPPAIVEEFARRKWRYVRRFNGLLGFKWEVVFGTTERSGVETYCRENAMACQWSDDGALTVTYVRDAVREHPATGERVWFNHGLFFNPISIEPALREALLESFSPEELPYNTFFGDGQPVPLEVLSEIRKAYDAETRQFDWHRGDVLMLDNMLTAHGRSAYSGTRQVVAGLAESHALPLEELSAATRSVAMV